ncbi:MAG: GGDEF domain-containing protein [Cellvibrionaceae bacterium]|nr:GGDEF domain-containing protein [Cellvibrionaceae bacterium]MCV6625277.1 GGDEF domain-containing protein [Cellvibrionaceae bacterium]
MNSGTRPSADRSNHQLRVALCLSLFMTVVCCFFAVLNYVRQLYYLAALELVIASCSILFYLAIVKRWQQRSWLVEFVLFFNLSLVLIFCAPQTGANVFLWMLLMPLISYAALGRKQGFCFSLVFLVATLFIFNWRFELLTDLESMAVFFNIFFSSMVVWGVSHVHEGSRVEQQQQLMKLAAEDALTGLYNRFRLNEFFNREVALAKRENSELSLLLMDLDRFKKVNDRYGHDVGDQVLMKVAQLIKNNIRQSDYAFRVGGEEFCVILPAANSKEAEIVAENLRQLLAQTVLVIADIKVSITISIGVCQWRPEQSSFAEIYSLADRCMYQAKHQGRNQVMVYQPQASAAQL